MRVFLLLSIAICLPGMALAQVYRWVDPQGQVHYTQTPPRGQNAAIVAPPPPPSASPNQDALNKSLGDSVRAEPARKRDAEQAAAAQGEKEAQCRDATARLVTLDAQTANRLRVTQEEYDRRHQELEAFLAKNCR